MGKRNNRDAPVGRRRPMIQLGGGSQKSGLAAVSRNVIKEKENAKIEVASTSTKEVDKIDAELAGFMAEINSLDGPSEASNGSNASDSATKDTVEQSSQDALLYDPSNFDPATQGHLLPEPWHCCYDESTAYYYYWNTVTNEVQWYPPVSTVPPPPPPPSASMEEEKDTADKKDIETNTLQNENGMESETSKNNSLEHIEKDNKPEIKPAKQSLLKNLDYGSDSSDEEVVTNTKDKDRELMNQIKEKIKKKKEEKLLKEKIERERELREEEESLEREQKEKEEKLREKLIKKKFEREKMLKNVDGEDKEDENIKENSLNVPTDVEDAFSVDIFAIEDAESRKTQSIDKIEETVKETVETETAPEPIAEEEEIIECKELSENKSQSEQLDPVEKTVDHSKEDTLKELKGGWRIIDYVYDDEVDDDDSSDESDAGDNKKLRDAETLEKSTAEIDDYVEMLLEDGIGEKEEIKSKTKAIDLKPREPSLPPETPPPPPTEDIRPPLPPEDEPLPDLPKVSPLEEEVNRKEISETSTQIFEKLDFLGISTKEMRDLTIHFIELETRMKDWQAGALDSKYLLDRLHDLDVQIKKHEETAAPQGWLCHWSSDFKMYYYHNILTGESQWEYPDIPHIASVAPNQYQSMTMIPPVDTPAGGMDYMKQPDTSHSMSASAASLVSPAHGFSRDPLPVERKRRAGSEEKSSDPYRDPYRKKKKDTFPDLAEDTTTQTSDSGTSSPLPSSVIAAAPMIRNVSREASPSIYLSQPPLPPDDIFVREASPLAIANKDSIANKAKLKKKKKLEAAGLPSKKRKHVTSLVQKWQTVKQKVEEEENIVEESDDEDFEERSERRISEWKQEVERSGRKGHNPNFQEIRGDWRERLKKKTTS